MSLKDYKLTKNDIETKGVVAAPNVLNGTAAENKAIFDRLIREALMGHYNNLVDELTKLGVEQLIQCGDGSVLYLRVNSEKMLEVSTDGEKYEIISSSGHKIFDADGYRLPQRSNLQFSNSEVIDNGYTTIIRAKPAWEEIKNRPLTGAEEVYFEWSPTYVPTVGPNEYQGFYKASSTPLSKEELLGCMVDYTTSVAYGATDGTVTVTDDIIDVVNGGESFIVYLGDYLDLAYPIISVQTTFDGLPLDMVLDRGLWVAFDYPGEGDTIKKLYKMVGEVFDKSVLPPVSWEELENRPFGEIVYEDSCVPAELTAAFTVTAMGYQWDFYKMSDTALSYEQLQKTVFTAQVGSVVANCSGNGLAFLEENENYTFLFTSYLNIDGDYPVVSAYATGEMTLSGNTFTIPEVGMYVGKLASGTFPSDGAEKFIFSYSCEDGVKKIDEKYLPERDTGEVKFEKDLITTYEIGSVTLENGRAVIPAAGKSLQEVWDTIFVTELPPTVEEPKVTLTAAACKPYEVGEEVTPSYNAVLLAGAYAYGPDTGVVATAWEVINSKGVKITHSGDVSGGVAGEFSIITVEDDTEYRITAVAVHGAGAVPLTNLGNAYPEGQIEAGTKEATSAAITGYRNGFYGTADTKDAPIDSAFVRALVGKSGKTPAAGNVWNLAVPVGTLRIAFAYPATIRDVSSVLDVNGMNAEIKTAFTKHTVKVEGANGYTGIDYKVYVLDRAAATTEANTFKITI